MADIRVHKRKRTGDGLFVYHKRLITSPAVHFKPDVRMSSLEDAFKPTWKAFENNRPESSLGSAFVSVRKVTDDDEGDWDSRDTPLLSSSALDQNCVVLFSIQGLTSGVGLPAYDIGLNVLSVTEWGFCDSPTLKEMPLVLLDEQAEEKSGAAFEAAIF